MIWRLFINPIMIFLMRSPLHFLVSHSVIVLYVFGTKTGKLYRIPVSFFEHRKGLLTCVTDKPNIWWKNLKEEKNDSVDNAALKPEEEEKFVTRSQVAVY